VAAEWADRGTDREVPGRDSDWGVEGDLAARELEAAEPAAAVVPACGNRVDQGAGVARGQAGLAAGPAEEDSAAVLEQEVAAVAELTGAEELVEAGEQELAGAVELVEAGEQELAGAVELVEVEVGPAEEDSAAELAGAEELVEEGEQELVVVE